MNFYGILLSITLLMSLSRASPINKTETSISSESNESSYSGSYEVIEPQILKETGAVIDDDSDESVIILYDESKSDRRIKREATDALRDKRALVFRPLFVYKQQEVKRERVKEQRRTKTTKKSKSNRSG